VSERAEFKRGELRAVAEIMAASAGIGELDAAWAEAEAALPEDWELRLFYWGDPKYGATASYRFSLGRGRAVPFEQEYGPTPAAALRALAEQLRERMA
jgi:hypothetical protein